MITNRRAIPLYIRILIGVALGIAAGATLRERAAPLSETGLLVIRLLKALATPLILFAVLDAFLRTRIPARKGAILIGISLMNALVAIVIGLSVAYAVRGGERWRGRMQEMVSQVASAAGPAKAAKAAPEATLNPIQNVGKYIPENVIDPFRENSVITVVLIAVLAGAALRKLKDGGREEIRSGIETIEGVVRSIFAVLAQILEWIVWTVPLAVFGIVAGVVGKTGPGIFAILGVFLATILLGLVIHAVVYYSLLLRILGGWSPGRFFSGASDSIVTALSCGSSLATLPVTLRCLSDRLKVSTDSARLAACVGTNLNHDGIILYEASAAIFMVQALGYPVSATGQVSIALASVMAGVGIAGVPEAGLITLPLVLGAAGIPTAASAVVIPLILPVDWIIGRFRAAVNVTSDMTVAVLLDRFGNGAAGRQEAVLEAESEPSSA